MFGKLLFFFFAVGFAQEFASPTPTSLKGALDDLKEWIEKAKESIENVIHMIDTKCEELVQKAKIAIDDIINKAKEILNKAGECGKALLPKLDELNRDILSTIENCIIDEIPQAQKIAQDLKDVVEEVSKLVAEVTIGIENCKSLGKLKAIACVTKLAIDEQPKLLRAIEHIVPLVKETVQAVKDFNNCIDPRVGELKQDVDAIINEVQNCGKLQMIHV